MTDLLREHLQILLHGNPRRRGGGRPADPHQQAQPGGGEKARLSIKRKSLAGLVDIANRVQKFVDCRTKDVGPGERHIVGGTPPWAVKQGRDAEFQGIMPVRGKILNCLKADYGKIFKSEIITDLLKVMGCGVEVQDKHNKGRPCST